MRIIKGDWDEILYVSSQKGQIFKCRQRKNIEKIEKKKERRDSNELYIKITWVLESDGSENEFQLSILFQGQVYIDSFKNILI